MLLLATLNFVDRSATIRHIANFNPLIPMRFCGRDDNPGINGAPEFDPMTKPTRAVRNVGDCLTGCIDISLTWPKTLSPYNSESVAVLGSPLRALRPTTRVSRKSSAMSPRHAAALALVD